MAKKLSVPQRFPLIYAFVLGVVLSFIVGYLTCEWMNNYYPEASASVVLPIIYDNYDDGGFLGQLRRSRTMNGFAVVEQHYEHQVIRGIYLDVEAAVIRLNALDEAEHEVTRIAVEIQVIPIDESIDGSIVTYEEWLEGEVK